MLSVVSAKKNKQIKMYEKEKSRKKKQLTVDSF